MIDFPAPRNLDCASGGRREAGRRPVLQLPPLFCFLSSHSLTNSITFCPCQFSLSFWELTHTHTHTRSLTQTHTQALGTHTLKVGKFLISHTQVHARPHHDTTSLAPIFSHFSVLHVFFLPRAAFSPHLLPEPPPHIDPFFL